MSSDPQAHITQQPITHSEVSSSASAKATTGFTRPASEPDHADTSSFTVGSFPFFPFLRLTLSFRIPPLLSLSPLLTPDP